MLEENIEFLFEATFKETGKHMRDTVLAGNLYEATNIVDNQYGIDNFKKFSIEPVREE